VAGKLVFSEPKNASRRTIDLPQRALETLRTHRKRQLEEQLRSGAAWADNGLVFATTIGTPLEAQNIINRHFKPLLRRAGLPNIRWHDLRHTAATLLLARGTPQARPTPARPRLDHHDARYVLSLDTEHGPRHRRRDGRRTRSTR
jgi:integrase